MRLLSVLLLKDGQIEQVIRGGENYDGARPCDFDWVKKLMAGCVARRITFCFIETGAVFIKDGKRHHPAGDVRNKFIRRFSAGIPDVFQGKSTQHGGKSSGVRACCPFFKYSPFQPEKRLKSTA